MPVRVARALYTFSYEQLHIHSSYMCQRYGKWKRTAYILDRFQQMFEKD